MSACPLGHARPLFSEPARSVCFSLIVLLLAPMTLLASDRGEPDSGDTIRCELAVVGGGSGGFGAALAAARQGVDVVLVERADRLGGTSVRGGVNCWEMGAGGTGIPFELYLQLKQHPDAVGIYSFGRHILWYDPAQEPYRFPGSETVIDPDRTYFDTLQEHGTRGMALDEAACRDLWHGVPFEPDAMAHCMQEMLRATGHCRILFHATCTKATVDDGRITQALLDDGRVLLADYYIDATGDGALCQAAGCQIMIGQEPQSRFGEPHAPPEATRRLNGVSLIFRVTRAQTPGVEPLPAGLAETCWWGGRFPVAAINHYPNGDLNVNMLPTMDGAEFLTLGYQLALTECQRRVRAYWHHLQTDYAEFRAYRLSWIAPALGIRESQRVLGEYVLTENDLLAGINRQEHGDIICLADHSLDTHGSHARDSGKIHEPYGVPYRCLIPLGTRNLLVACRAASFSSLAASSCRLSRTMMQLGQAAGTAVALAQQQQVELPDVPPAALRAQLRSDHVQLEHPMPAELRDYVRQRESSLDIP